MPYGALQSGARLPLKCTEVLMIDTPAGLRAHEFERFMRHADVVLVPVVPSPIDGWTSAPPTSWRAGTSFRCRHRRNASAT